MLDYCSQMRYIAILPVESGQNPVGSFRHIGIESQTTIHISKIRPLILERLAIHGETSLIFQIVALFGMTYHLRC